MQAARVRLPVGVYKEFEVNVKFYPTTPTTIVDDHARYYVFLQLRRDILTFQPPPTLMPFTALLSLR
uniref:FERM domain-containing protein n=1 Tax=Caenorhabditis japonica TaxID=281687 RepID=A0A8R1ER43_CAEJA